MAMSHFTFALAQWISMRSQNREDQSTSGDRQKWFVFWGSKKDWTQSPRLPGPELRLREKPALLMSTSHRMWHPHTHPHRLFFQNSEGGSIWFEMSQPSSQGPSPGSRVVTPHLLLSSSGVKWPIHNGSHRIVVRQCYDVWWAAIGCDSSCQSLLLPRQVLLNHDGLYTSKYSHWRGGTDVTLHECNLHLHLLCFTGAGTVITHLFALVHVIAPIVVKVHTTGYSHAETHIGATTWSLTTRERRYCVLVHRRLTSSKTSITYDTLCIKNNIIFVLAGTVTHTRSFMLWHHHVSIKTTHLQLADVCPKKGAAEWLIGRPCAPRFGERIERHTSDRCQNSQEGAMMKNERREDERESKRGKRRTE